MDTPTTNRIVLPKGDFFELRALLRDVEVAQFEAQKAAAEHTARVQRAKTHLVDRLTAISAEHGFNPDGTYGWDDATCALIRKDVPT